MRLVELALQSPTPHQLVQLQQEVLPPPGAVPQANSNTSVEEVSITSVTVSTSVDSCCPIGDKPSLRDLHCLRYHDKGGEERRLFIIDTIAAEWRRMGLALTFTDSDLNNIERDHRRVQDCCSELLSRWLQGAVAGPVTWQRLLEAMNDVHLTELAQQLGVVLFQEEGEEMRTLIVHLLRFCFNRLCTSHTHTTPLSHS